MKVNLIDPGDPKRRWIATIEPDGRVSKMTQIPEFANEDEERQFWAEHDSVDYLERAEQVWLEYVWDEEGLKKKQ